MRVLRRRAAREVAVESVWLSDRFTAREKGHAMRPGVHLRELMDYAGLTGRMGVRMVARLAALDESVVDGILSGKQKITKNIAQHLAVGTQPLAISAQFWLNLENTYRAALKAGKKDVSDDG